jgi:hypothetical protein
LAQFPCNSSDVSCIVRVLDGLVLQERMCVRVMNVSHYGQQDGQQAKTPVILLSKYRAPFAGLACKALLSRPLTD